jgi:hypothetical protein
LKDRIYANEDLELVDITGEYLQELDDLGTLQLLEANIAKSKRLVRKPIFKRVLAMMQEYQLNGIPANKILEIRSSLAICLTAVLEENPQHIILTSSTASGPVLSSHIPKLHMEEAFGLEKTLKSLLRILTNETECLDKKLKACKALRELLDEKDFEASRNSTVQDELRNNNAIPIVLTLAHSNIPTLCEEGCVVLRILARNMANKDAIREAEGISVLVSLLCDESSAVRENAAGALINVSVNAENCVSIREAGGISVLVRLLCDENSAVREQAAGALMTHKGGGHSVMSKFGHQHIFLCHAACKIR